ncbi:MAG: precorrin-6Y C5,15-methyltransferase (decarboxylating) subunit CbiT [Dialister sp.]|nr:precorrin-6Y C5,15-methyltransferase (decarboxylating) subunit CbiT [Dialister sp.]
MTKAEIRAMVMVKARIEETDTVADIGAGTGSLTIEAARCASKGKVYAIERNPEGIRLIQENAAKFHCDNIEIIEGAAPDAMSGLPALDVVIIGGSGGNMAAIIDRAEPLLTDSGRFIITAVTAETTGEVVELFKNRPYQLEGFELQVNRLRKLGRYHLFNPLSPVFIFTAKRLHK